MIYEWLMGRWSRLVSKAFLAWLAPQKRRQRLDVGCGNGAYTEGMAFLNPLCLAIFAAQAVALVNDNANRLHTSTGRYNSDRSNSSAPAERPLRAVRDPSRPKPKRSSRAGHPNRTLGALRSHTNTSPARSIHNRTSNGAGRGKHIGLFR
jgi:hypothetical protein